ADLLASKNFTALLHSLAAHYDFVLIDTAPVLAFTDAMVIAPHAGAIYNVVRDGVSTVNEIEETVRRLTQAGGKVTGTIFNDMKGRAAYRYGY
ncbi:MAG TPA: tyrosine protein kinase, partial [Noviherbaspirillum sp.]